MDESAVRCKTYWAGPTGQNWRSPHNWEKVLKAMPPITDLVAASQRKTNPRRLRLRGSPRRKGPACLDQPRVRGLPSSGQRGRALAKPASGAKADRSTISSLILSAPRSSPCGKTSDDGPRFVKFKPFIAPAEDVAEFAAAA